MTQPKPIFILFTRSFWLGLLPAALAVLDVLSALAGGETAGAVATIIAQVFGVDVATAEKVIRAVGTVSAFVVAHQRRGANRPYSLNPKDR